MSDVITSRVCAKCGVGKPLDLHVDHDHADGRIRGLLCATCNHAIGLLGDTYEGVCNALRYLSQ